MNVLEHKGYIAYGATRQVTKTYSYDLDGNGEIDPYAGRRDVDDIEQWRMVAESSDGAELLTFHDAPTAQAIKDAIDRLNDEKLGKNRKGSKVNIAR